MSAAPVAGLSEEEVIAFHRDGFLVLTEYLSSPATEALTKAAQQLLSSFSLEDHPGTAFTTGDGAGRQAAHVGDDYFLDSGDKVRFFFEPEALGEKGELVRRKEEAVNKVGHGLHMQDAVFATATVPGTSTATANGHDKSTNGATKNDTTTNHLPTDPAILAALRATAAKNAAIARSLFFADPRVLQSMLLCKPPAIGAPVPCHRDSDFLYTRPPSAVGFWVALQQAGDGNGGLVFLRGSHRRAGGKVSRRFVRWDGVRENGGGGEQKEGGKKATGTGFIPWNGPGYAPDVATEAAANTDPEPEAADYDRVAVAVPPGGLVLIHGNVLHLSERNISMAGRLAYAFHLIEGEDAAVPGQKGERFEYDGMNWLQPPAGGFTRLYG